MAANDAERARYQCNCGEAQQTHHHVHEASVETAQTRGVHGKLAGFLGNGSAVSTNACHVSATGPALFATSMQDAVEGALIGAMIGDAVAAPLHWMYNWPEAQAYTRKFFGGRLRGLVSVPEAARMSHPDSWKYFAKCDPAAEPAPQLFGDAKPWQTPGTTYHAGLQSGDNTLTARLLLTSAASLHTSRGFCADDYLERYLSLLLDGKGTGENADTWVDESHRVFIRNLAEGASPAEAGLDDCCLTGLALATPVQLAYIFNRDAADLASRCQLQFTHKQEDMAAQVGWWGDLLRHLLAAVAQGWDGDNGGGGAQQSSSSEASVQAGIHAATAALCATFSAGKVDLQSTMARFDAHLLGTAARDAAAGGVRSASAAVGRESAGDGAVDDNEGLWRGDEAAFHGPGAVFSLR